MFETYTAAVLLSTKNHVPKELPPPSNPGGKRKRRTKRATVGAARVDIILNKLRGESGEKSIFLSVGQLSKEDIGEVMKAWAVRCNCIIKSKYSKITYFENHFQEEEVKEEEDPVAMELIKKAVEEATELLKTVEPYINEYEAYEKHGK